MHQFWPTRQLHVQEESLARFEHLNRPFEHTLWTEADSRKLWARHWPAFLPIYDGYESFVQAQPY